MDIFHSEKEGFLGSVLRATVSAMLLLPAAVIDTSMRNFGKGKKKKKKKVEHLSWAAVEADVCVFMFKYLLTTVTT